MKGPGILWGFAPLIVYAIFAGGTVEQTKLALLAALVAAVVAGYYDLQKGMVMAWANLAIFGLPLVALGLFGQVWIISWMNVLVYAGLAAVAFGSVLARRPFTLQYAREMVPREIQEHPEFLRVNRFMTGVWGTVFAINLGLSALAGMGPPGYKDSLVLLTFIVLAAGIAFTLWYPSHVRKRKGVAGDRDGPGQ
jgi:uncharacterized membrane protein